MDDNLPNQNSPWPPHPSDPSTPPNPPANTVHPVQSWVAQHEARDAHGHFVKSDHLTNPQPTPNPSSPPDSSNLPPLIKVDDGKGIKAKDEYPPIFQIANPVTYLRIFWNKVMKNEGIKIGFNFTVKPVTAVMIALALTGTYSLGYHFGITDTVRIFFPNSSPILHRAISLQGTVQKSETGQYYLSLPDNTLWILRPTSSNINLAGYANKLVTVKGNLTSEKNVVNVTEVIAFEKSTTVIYTPASQSASSSAKNSP